VQAALGEKLEAISTFYEMTSAGKPFLELDQWLGALEGKLLFSDLNILGYTVRLTESQAKAAFYASAATPASGLLPDELPICIARTACDKYKNVTAMTPGSRVTGFLNNLLGSEDDEEDVVRKALGTYVAKVKENKGPMRSADGFLMAAPDKRITGVASGTGDMLMPDERSMANRSAFETASYNASRDSIDKSVGASMAESVHDEGRGGARGGDDERFRESRELDHLGHAKGGMDYQSKI